MRRELRLRRSADFERARTQGRRWVHTVLAGYGFSRADREPTRVGIIVGRRTGKAVVRNRIKRRIREAVRAHYDSLPPGYDVVLIARPGAAEATQGEIDRAVAGILAQVPAWEARGG